MGSCLSLDPDDKRAKERSAEIDRHLQLMAREASKTIRILLLGAGESGKSTLVKQMKIIHNDGFTINELLSFKPTVLDNMLNSMKYVLNGMGILRINLANPNNKVHAQNILSCQKCFDERHNVLPYIANSLHCLWNDRGVRAAVSRGFEYELNDSAIYARFCQTGRDLAFSYFENMERICSEKFIPNSTDVLRARVRTTGIIETCFRINDLTFRLFDVGGQRTERRKWIQCFDDVKAILFVVALSGYDMTLHEDSKVNRLQESLQLFTSICNNRFFKETSIILFLNKLDLFQEKILYSERHLRYYYPAYTGPDRDVDRAAMFIQGLYQRANKNPTKVVYPHFTTATDTSNIQVVFQVVMESIIKDNLKHAELL